MLPRRRMRMFDLSTMSPRESEVVQLYAQGFGTVEIAAILNLSVKTIESHRTRVKLKYEIASGRGWMQLLRQYPLDTANYGRR